jgi:hypothetical protein
MLCNDAMCCGVLWCAVVCCGVLCCVVLCSLITMAPWDGIKRAQRKTTGRAIAKANKDTDADFKRATKALVTAFKDSTCAQR